MKKILLLLCLSVGCMAVGQNKSYSDVAFFGTDFSQVKIYGADDSQAQFQKAFYEINRLLLNEPKKYNVGKILKINISTIDLKPVEMQHKDMDMTGMLIDGYGGYVLTDQQLEQAVKNLQINSGEGTGLVLVAEVLNKSSRQGSFKIVFFNMADKKILEVRDGKGKAQGFGLRNFWANAMLEAIKKAK